MSVSHRIVIISVVAALACLALLSPASAEEGGAKVVKPFADLGEEFLERVAKRPFAHKLPSGIVFEVLERAPGLDRSRFCTKMKPTTPWAPFLETYYTLRDIFGYELDGKKEGGGRKPMRIELPGTFIPGWSLSVPHIPERETWRLYIPPSLGYGSAGSGSIPPHSVLVFDVKVSRVTRERQPRAECRRELAEELSYDPYTRDDERGWTREKVATRDLPWVPAGG